MLFSDCFNIQKNGQEDWFDPILDDDTLLFVDPFLIYLDNSTSFNGSYQKIMEYFGKLFEEAAITPFNVNSPRFKVLLSKAVFKEPKEACLGYSVGSVAGAGSCSGFAKNIVTAIYDSINAGINNLNHFEELGIFGTNIQEDRISDITINILKEEFIAYTHAVCYRLNITTEELPCRIFDSNTSRWGIKKYKLPRNPFTDGPVILIPRKYLASINAINSQDFFDYCWEQYDDNVKDQLNVALKSAVDKKKIIEIAQKNPNWVSQYLQYKETRNRSDPYDLDNDPSGVYKWHVVTEHFVENNPIAIDVVDHNSFISFLDIIANKFQLYIENSDGYLMLIDSSSKPKREKAAQLLLYGLIKHYCKSIACKYEVKDPGKGVSNFTFSSKYQAEAFLEIKYARNNEIAQTLESFLKKTDSGDTVINGYYLVVCFKQTEFAVATEMEENLLSMAEEYNFQLKYKLIDARIN